MSDLIGKSFIELIYPDDQKLVMQRYKDRLAGKHLTDPLEFRIWDNDGSVRYAEGVGSFIELYRI